MDSYSPPRILFNGHLETICPAIFRKVDLNKYSRERILTHDSDFLDLDWMLQSSEKLLILSHGLEGNSTRAYIKGMAKTFYHKGFDVLAWNYRGCSEEMNKTLRFYHSGATEDLDFVVNHAIQKGYKEIILIGFSLGGNLTLKYVGEKADRLNQAIKKAIAFSVPLNLYTSCLKISEPQNWIYSKRFLSSLEKKVIKKAEQFPELDIEPIRKIKSLIEFDDVYTAPIHGFKGALDYYQKCSSSQFLSSIKIPTLLVNAKNDPFLSIDCYPAINNHQYLNTEYPERGGHVGFTLFNQNGLYWSELRAMHFVETGQ